MFGVVKFLVVQGIHHTQIIEINGDLLDVATNTPQKITIVTYISFSNTSMHQPCQSAFNEFLRSVPVAFKVAFDPEAALRWMKSIENILTIIECTNTQKVRFSA